MTARLGRTQRILLSWLDKHDAILPTASELAADLREHRHTAQLEAWSNTRVADCLLRMQRRHAWVERSAGTTGFVWAITPAGRAALGGEPK